MQSYPFSKNLQVDLPNLGLQEKLEKSRNEYLVVGIGLNLVSTATAFTGAIIALSVYAFGKTFFWPTMLAVASDRFPRSGAIAISIMGGIGMMSSGLLGSPGLGYAKDRFSGEALNESNPALYQEYKAETPSKWLFLNEVNGIDATKLGEISKKETAERTDNEKAVAQASIEGDRRTLKADSFIPAAMAVIYLLLFFYFKGIGGYKPLTIDDLTGGTFTITNGGTFGSMFSTPIINPPQVGILGMHAIKKKPVVINDEIAIRPMMYLALTYDHRLVDGGEAVQFLVRIKNFIEDPQKLLIEN